MTTPSTQPSFKFEDNTDWSLIPDYMREGVRSYVEDHRRQGDFLMALFSNDLRAAVAHADEMNKLYLPRYVSFMLWYANARCWGSSENVAKWLENNDG